MQRPAQKRYRSRFRRSQALRLPGLSLGLLLLSQSACQMLPSGTSLLPELQAAQIDSRSETSATLAKVLKPNQTKGEKAAPADTSVVRYNPKDHYTPLKDSPEPAPENPPPAQGIILIIPERPQPSPTATPAGPQYTFNLSFSATGESALSASYPVRISLENAQGTVLSMTEAFSRELATGVKLVTTGLSQGEGYRIRLAGKAYTGSCISQAQFLLTGDTAQNGLRLLAADDTSLGSGDFSPVALKSPCQQTLRIHGQVVDRHGNGLPGVQLEAKAFHLDQNQQQTDKLDYVQSTVSDSDGFYTLEAFPAGVPVHLSGSQGGFVSSEKLLNFEFNQIESASERHDSNLVMLEAE